MAFSQSSGAMQDAAPSPSQQTPLVHIAGVPRSNGLQSCLRCLEELPNAAAVPGAYLIALANERYWPVAMDAWEDSRGLSCQRCSPVENDPIANLLETPLDILNPPSQPRPSYPRSEKLGQACYLGEHGMCMRLNCDCECHVVEVPMIPGPNGPLRRDEPKMVFSRTWNEKGLTLESTEAARIEIEWPEIKLFMGLNNLIPEPALSEPELAIKPILEVLPYAFSPKGIEIYGEGFKMRRITWPEIENAMHLSYNNMPPEVLADLTQDQAGTVAKILKKGEADDALIMCSDCKTQPAVSCGLCAGCIPF